MNQTFAYFFLLLTCVLPFVSGCDVTTTFDEGPYASVYTVEDRVINTWEWAYALEEGYNRTGELADSTITFEGNGTLSICNSEGQCREGSWHLISKKTKINMIFGDKATAYDIIMLKKNEMWLRSEQGALVDISWELVSAL
ncbi:MAG: hypothetical protein SF052_27095 [Bacteroidia bacterium]|nr:hypothetical protein [Bacteroidia bacterium]